MGWPGSFDLFCEILFLSLLERGRGLFPAKFNWKSLVPSKVAFLFLLVYQERALTTNILMLKSMQIYNWCLMCYLDAENNSYLFIQCPMLDDS